MTDFLSNQLTKKLRIFMHFARGALYKTPSCICNTSATAGDGSDISWRGAWKWKHWRDLGNFETLPESVGVVGLFRRSAHRIFPSRKILLATEN